MMKTKLIVAAVLAAVTTLALSAPVRATVLFVKNFEGTLTTDITKLGWTMGTDKEEVGTMLVSNTTIDSGKSAVSTRLVSKWTHQGYNKAFKSPYSLTEGETVTLTGVF